MPDWGSRARETAIFERETLDCSLTPGEMLQVVKSDPWPFALVGSWAGGGAILGSVPLLVADPDADPFAVLDALPTLTHPPDGGTPVGGGWFGWLGYRLGRRVERLPEGPNRPVPLPEFHLAYYDHVLRLDADGRWWFETLVSPGRRRVLSARLAELRERLTAGPPPPDRERPGQDAGPPPFRVAGGRRSAHLSAVQECRERIAAGEIFQANICLRLETGWDGTVMELFDHALGHVQPPFGAVFQTPWGGIASLSPELFLRRRGDVVTAGPIKGTIRREGDETVAARARAMLRASAKDAAEHVMIVDLMRNDLGRVCAYGSVQAPPAPQAQAHPGLWHLVSYVQGRLRPGVSDRELLRATFPPGSVTGAPKVQAMKVIADLETTGREVYTGAIGFVSPLAGLEMSVAIRTFELREGRLWLGAGGGIVADSDPELEFAEALTKGAPLIAAIGSRISDAAEPDPARGVFETLLVRDGDVQALELHLRRLAGAVRDLYRRRLPDDLAACIRAAAGELSGAHRVRVRAIPEPRLGGLKVELETEPFDPETALVPLELAPVAISGGFGPYKWCDRGLLDGAGTGDSVPLIVDDGDQLLEAAWANVWIIEGRRIVTPRADGRLLAGVTREMLLALAPALGLIASTDSISMARARRADGVFLTSSLRHAIAAALPGGPSVEGAEMVTARIRAVLSDAGWDRPAAAVLRAPVSSR